VPAFLLACLSYLGVALPSSPLGLLWPSIRLSFGEPIGALGVLLAFGVTASVISSAATARILATLRVGVVLAIGTMLTALALAAEAAAPALWVFGVGMVVFGLGFGLIDSALNAHAASQFGARDINWMHASYGLGATIGPLVVTALLTAGSSWRLAYGVFAGSQAALALVLIVTRRRWRLAPRPAAAPGRRPGQGSRGPGSRRSSRKSGHRTPTAAVLRSLVFTAVENGIESGAGIWGYVFLTAGRHLPPGVAGVAVSAYWATMFVGRAVLGPAAERLGAGRILAGAVTGVPLGAALMTVPGPGAVAGLMILGLAAAPVFPLFTLTTAQRVGAADDAGTTRTVSLQVASSAIGSAALPAGLGLAIGAFDANVLAPSLLVLGVLMCGLYWLLSRGVPARDAYQRRLGRGRLGSGGEEMEAQVDG
jgi:fucose permease